MNGSIQWTAWAVFLVFFGLVSVLGFVASHWRRGDLTHLHEWGLGGRRFGTFVTWFLLGGDLYTAYTVIAVPALVYAVGAYGFFRAALHDHCLSVRFRGHAAAMERVPAP